jgi:hypothetical protein
VQTWFGEAAAALAAGDPQAAATCYDEAAVIAHRDQSLILAIEAFRMGAFCHARFGDTSGAIERGMLAMDTGAHLKQEARGMTTLPMAAVDFLRVIEPDPVRQLEQIKAGLDARLAAARQRTETRAIAIENDHDPSRARQLEADLDPFDYLPIIGATVTVCGMKRATAGTNGIAVHIPPGFPFAPKLPDKDDELFMGSATVVADGDPFSYIALPVLSCQVAGMLSPIRLRKKGGPKAMVLPTVFNLAIPTTVFLGGPPTISMMGLAFKAAFKALGKFAKSGLFKRMRRKLFGKLKPGFLKCAILRAEPVNILTGEVSVEQEDFTLPGRIAIEWVRAYSSGSRRPGVCGDGWETPADTRLEVDPADGTVSLHHPTVGPLFFANLPVATGNAAAELQLMDGARLTDHGDEFRVRTKEDRVYHFPKALATVNQLGMTEYPIGRLADLWATGSTSNGAAAA